MKTQTDITQEKETSPVQRGQQEPSDGGTAQLVDNRESTIYQQKLQEGIYASTENSRTSIARKVNKTGLPDNLKTGIENLSGYNMDDVKVHYNSSKPAQLQAHAYAQGTDIHLASGQEKHLPHEAWHVVQQKQGRVKPTRQLKSKVNINDDSGLEKEADVMGALSLRKNDFKLPIDKQANFSKGKHQVVQKVENENWRRSPGAKVGLEIETNLPVRANPENATVTDEIKKRQLLLQIINNKNDYATQKKLLGTEFDQERIYKEEGIKETLKEEVLEGVKNLLNSIDAGKTLKDLIMAYLSEDLSEENTPRVIVKSLQDGFIKFDTGYKKDVHVGSGWKAVSEQVPDTSAGFMEGHLLSKSGVEIVTDPVSTLEEAENIMEDIQDWLAEVMEGVKSSDTDSYEEGAFVFEIPKGFAKSTDIKSKGFLGNIQVNVGAHLEDVQRVFQANVLHDDMGEKKQMAKIMSDFEELWILVKQEPKPKKKFLNFFSKSKQDRNITLLEDGGVTPEDEPFLKGILFQYFYSAVVNTVYDALDSEKKGESSKKNKYPILIKTPVETQARLSNWRNFGEKWDLSKNATQKESVKKLRKQLGIAFIQALRKLENGRNIKEEGKESLKNNILSEKWEKGLLKAIDTGVERQLRKEVTGHEITKEEDLVLEGDPPRYAGVFEIRYFQNIGVLQSKWLDVWKTYLEEESQDLELKERINLSSIMSKKYKITKLDEALKSKLETGPKEDSI